MASLVAPVVDIEARPGAGLPVCENAADRESAFGTFQTSNDVHHESASDAKADMTTRFFNSDVVRCWKVRAPLKVNFRLQSDLLALTFL